MSLLGCFFASDFDRIMGPNLSTGIFQGDGSGSFIFAVKHSGLLGSVDDAYNAVSLMWIIDKLIFR